MAGLFLLGFGCCLRNRSGGLGHANWVEDFAHGFFVEEFAFEGDFRGGGFLQVFGAQTGVFGDAREHFGADFYAVVEGPDEIAARRAGQQDV